MTVQAHAIDMTPELKKVVEGAKAEGKLRIETLPDVLAGAEGVKAATAWMKREFNIDVEGSFVPNPAFAQQLAKLFTEMQSGQKASSDAFSATAVQVTPMLDRGVFVSVPWTQLLPGRITPDIVEADGRALRTLTQMPGILYNKAKFPEVKDVKQMADLLKPEFKDKFVTTPYLAGYDVLLSNDKWGYDKTAEYVTQLASSGVRPRPLRRDRTHCVRAKSRRSRSIVPAANRTAPASRTCSTFMSCRTTPSAATPTSRS